MTLNHLFYWNYLFLDSINERRIQELSYQNLNITYNPKRYFLGQWKNNKNDTERISFIIAKAMALMNAVSKTESSKNQSRKCKFSKAPFRCLRPLNVEFGQMRWSMMSRHFLCPSTTMDTFSKTLLLLIMEFKELVANDF